MAYRRQTGHRRKKSKAWLFGSILSVFVFAGLATYELQQHHVTKPQVRHKISSLQTGSLPTEAQGKYLFSGTIVLSRDVARYAGSDYNQPFSDMYTLGNYNAHIGVLECPITNNYDSFQNEVQNLVFNCQPAWVPTLKKYFPVLDLSSDHLNDEGPQGIIETFQTLKQAGIQTVGTYNPASLNDDCKAIVLPINLIHENGQSSPASLPIAMCSYNYKELFAPTTGQLQSIQKWSKIMPVIALFNHGLEYQLTANSQTVTIAHQMINYGADFVIGNGTHWVQNTEIYKGKLIVYSMGNFIFDQIQYNGRIALNFSVTMTVKYNQNVERWISLANICLMHPENCLNIAEQDKLSKIQPIYRFNAVGSYGGDARVTALANSQQQADIDQIANWQSTAQYLAHHKNY